MSRAASWKALLWKEARETRVVFLTTLAVPWLALILAQAFTPRTHMERGNLFSLAAVAFSIMVVVWATSRGVVESRSRDFLRSHLPVGTWSGWLTWYVLGVVAAAAAGAWFGGWMSKLVWYDGVGRAQTEGQTAHMMLAGAILAGGGFAVMHYVAQVVSPLLAKLLGIPLVLIHAMNMLTTRDPLDGTDYLSVVSVAAVVASCIFNVAGRKWPLQRRQAVSLSVMVVAIVVMTIRVQPFAGVGGPSGQTVYEPPQIESDDWSRSVSRVPAPEGLTLVFIDGRTGRWTTMEFGEPAAPVDFLGPDSVYIAQQGPDDDSVLLRLWNGKTGRIEDAVMVPAGRGAIGPGRRGVTGFVRPDGRYMLLALRSLAGQGIDLWVVDLQRRTARVAYPNARFALGNVQWTRTRAFLSGYRDRPLEVDLRRATARALDLAADGGG